MDSTNEILFVTQPHCQSWGSMLFLINELKHLILMLISKWQQSLLLIMCGKNIAGFELKRHKMLSGCLTVVCRLD